MCQNEFRVSRVQLRDEDFLEGTSALLIDKGRKPNWKYQPIVRVSQINIYPFSLLFKVRCCENHHEYGDEKSFSKMFSANFRSR